MILWERRSVLVVSLDLNLPSPHHQLSFLTPPNHARVVRAPAKMAISVRPSTVQQSRKQSWFRMTRPTQAVARAAFCPFWRLQMSAPLAFLNRQPGGGGAIEDLTHYPSSSNVNQDR